MKTGLLLFQSVASSALRSGRGPSSCAGPAAAAARRSWSEGVRTGRRTDVGAVYFLAAAAGAVAVTGVAGAAGASSLAMCSGGNGNDETRGALVTTASATIPKSAAVADGRRASGRRSIDEPDDAPEHNPLLPFPESSLRHDTYNGVTLDLTAVAPHDGSATTALGDADAFGDMLSRALSIWAAEHRRGIWIKVPTAHSHLIAPATQLGFDFQHAERGYCVLTKWLPSDSESRLPNGPTHQVGIGALVVHPLTGKMLVVQERTGPAAKRKLWKMPTGLTDPGEDIAHAAVRELKEETGLDCIFDRIICFRQAHGGLFGRSDMFFVCLCRLAPEQEERIRAGEGEAKLLPQEEEILMADWIDMEDYADQVVWRESPLYREMNGAMIRAARRGIAYSSLGDNVCDCVNGDVGEDCVESHGFVAKNLPVGFRPGRNTIYVSSKL